MSSQAILGFEHVGVVVTAELQRRCFGHQAPHPAIGRDQLRHRVLAATRRPARSNRERAVLPGSTPVSVTTARTASKIRSGRPETRNRFRHYTSTVGSNPSSVSDRPAATFQAMSMRSSSTTSRSDRPPSDCKTITVAITSAGTDGRPRPDGNKSANNTSGNRRRRCSAKNPPPTRGHQIAAQRRRVQQLRFAPSCPAPHRLFDPTRKRQHPDRNCSASRFLATRQDNRDSPKAIRGAVHGLGGAGAALDTARETLTRRALREQIIVESAGKSVATSTPSDDRCSRESLYAPVVPDAHPETVTALFTDVVGSTLLRARLGDLAADVRMVELERASRYEVEHVGGTVVKSLGDGVMAVFSSAAAAVKAAVAIQRVSRRLSGAVDAITLHVGISSGDMIREGSDWQGTAAIEASRLSAAASAGEILVAESAVHLPRGRSAHTLTLLGMRVLHGFDSPVGVYVVDWNSEDDEALPHVLAEAASGMFIGREAELAFCQEALDATAGQHPKALLIVGEPGVGKTRLAAAVAGAPLYQMALLSCTDIAKRALKHRFSDSGGVSPFAR